MCAKLFSAVAAQQSPSILSGVFYKYGSSPFDIYLPFLHSHNYQYKSNGKHPSSPPFLTRSGPGLLPLLPPRQSKPASHNASPKDSIRSCPGAGNYYPRRWKPCKGVSQPVSTMHHSQLSAPKGCTLSYSTRTWFSSIHFSRPEHIFVTARSDPPD